MNFPLHPDTPAEGIALADLFGPGSGPRIAESQRRLKRLAEAEGLPMADRTMTYNSRLAQELGRWATSKGKGPAIHRTLFRAYFVDTRNISSPDILVQIAKDVGLDPKEAHRVLEQRTFREEVDAEWATCEVAGITAVPTFEAGGRRVVGAQPVEVLAQMLEEAGAKKR